MSDDGGFVYPTNDYDGHSIADGITRRNECADRIAASLVRINWSKTTGFPTPDADMIAKLAYFQADAMIAEGRKEQK